MKNKTAEEILLSKFNSPAASLLERPNFEIYKSKILEAMEEYKNQSSAPGDYNRLLGEMKEFLKELDSKLGINPAKELRGLILAQLNKLSNLETVVTDEKEGEEAAEFLEWAGKKDYVYHRGFWYVQFSMEDGHNYTASELFAIFKNETK